MILQANDIHKSYGSLEVLKGLDFHLSPGEIVSIVGASGAGKTTLLQILGTLDKADKGQVLFDGVNLAGLSGNKLAAFRNKHVGFIFQFHHLLPEFTALENVMMPALIGGASKQECLSQALQLLDLMKLSQRSSHKPSELSGGEQQRVAVARALMNKPTVVFADEPSGNLDSENAGSLHRLFLELRAALNQAFVIVTHNEELADMADRKLVMKDGRFVTP